jgi:hypothetical protein
MTKELDDDRAKRTKGIKTPLIRMIGVFVSSSVLLGGVLFS